MTSLLDSNSTICERQVIYVVFVGGKGALGTGSSRRRNPQT